METSSKTSSRSAGIAGAASVIASVRSNLLLRHLGYGEERVFGSRSERDGNLKMGHSAFSKLYFLILPLFAFQNFCTSEEIPSFSREVLPILADKCFACHGPDESARKANLRLDLAESAQRVIDSDSPDRSAMLLRIFHPDPEERMPPAEFPKQLTDTERESLRRWVHAGAPYEGHWAFRPLKEHAPPPVQNEAWPRTGIDRFILNALEARGMAPAPEADRRTLIRRLSFDLTGLPPTWQDVEAFIADNSPDSYEKLVDHLLASPQYGERWARHWLDVAHYGETHGYDKDKRRPNAWPYRDYVIRSLNDDKPYGRFVREQIAGDILYPNEPQVIVALGFIAAGPWDFVGHVELREGTMDKEITRSLDRDDMVSTVMNTFQSLTVQCARCHDHKFDPISAADYYALQSVFAGVERAERAYAEGQFVYAASNTFNPEGAFTPAPGGKREVRVLNRGDVKSPGEVARPGTVSCLPNLESRFFTEDAYTEAEARAALAQWITRGDNPLTWRSIVNRVWQYHFGKGIVDTPNDFGRMGAPPTHPELLDWLATNFLENGQSLKWLHKLIVTSAAYRQSSRPLQDYSSIDSGNQFLWRMERRQLEAEALRDATLFASGKLDLVMGGLSFDTFAFEDDHSPRYKYAELDPSDARAFRRAIYRTIVRSVPDPWMTTLDCADPSQSVPVRTQTITALQALAMYNDPFIARQAQYMAERLQRLSPTLDEQIRHAWQLALNRDPAEHEAAIMLQLVQAHGLAAACRVLLNSSEFMFVD